MMLNHASNAVSAKARTMYGNRLSEKDFRYLCGCKNVTEIALYLKSNTHYGKYMPSFHSGEIHRGALEAHLHQAYYEECSALCRYEVTVGDFFYHYIINTAEIDIMMRFLTLLSAGKTNEYMSIMPVYMDKHSNVDIRALANVKTFDELIKLTEGTPYRPIFFKHKPENGIYDFAGIECDLNNDLYKHTFAMIDKHTHGKEKKQLLDIFKMMLSAKNIDIIIRLKKYYKMSPDEIKNLLYNFGVFNNKQLDKLLNASENDIEKILSESSKGKKIMQFISDDSTTDSRLLSKISKKNIRSSPYPSVVLLSYLFLSEIEMVNVFNIIEGVRYEASPDMINNMLIY